VMSRIREIPTYVNCSAHILSISHNFFNYYYFLYTWIEVIILIHMRSYDIVSGLFPRMKPYRKHSHLLTELFICAMFIQVLRDIVHGL